MSYMEIYLDNAATSWPKPPEMMQAMVRYNEEIGGSAGRGAYKRAIKSAKVLSSTREKLSGLFNIKDESRIVFTLNCTHAINTVFWGMLEEGDHVVISSMEHNAVVRPLNELRRRRGIEYTVVEGDSSGIIDPQDYKRAIKKKTRLLVLIHGSNVCGTINPPREFGRIAREAEIPLMLDSAQTAGCVPIDIERDLVDILVFPGHKALLGPLGTGALYISDDYGLKSFFQGGTGSESHLEFQPDFYPDRMESGSHNAIGIAGWLASLGFIQYVGVDRIRDKKSALTAQLVAGLMSIDGVKYHGSRKLDLQLGVVSITFEGIDVADIAKKLDGEYGIMIRSGLHCAPFAHKTISTYKTGTIRLSLGYFNDESHIEHTLDSIRDLRSKY